VHDNAFCIHASNVKKDLLFAKIISNIVFSIQTNMTGYYDYLIVLSPSENIINRVKKYKGFSFNQIGEYESLHSQAHITVQFWPRKKPLWVEPLIPKLERELQLLPVAAMDINGFAFFNQHTSKTIYAKLKWSQLNDVWFKQVARYFNKRSFEPHITIAKSLPDDAFSKLWPTFKNREWDEHFKINKLVILKRETIGYDRSYKVFKEIYFNNKLDFNAFASAKVKKPQLSGSKIGVQQISLF
jgi:2'-5' RNA ligase